MGFFDKLKDAMKQASENANRKNAGAQPQAAPQSAQPAQAAHAPRKGNLPEGVIMAFLDERNMEPIVYGTDENGKDLILRVSGAVYFKQDDPDDTDHAVLRKKVAGIAREHIVAGIKTIDPEDLKSLLLLANRLGGEILEDLKANGYTASYKLPLILTPVRRPNPVPEEGSEEN
jgi:ribosomal protein S11